MPDHDESDQLPPLLLGHSIWAIRPDVLPRLIEAHRAHPTRLAAALSAVEGPQATTRRLAASSTRTAGAVAVIPLSGVITPRASFLSMLFGGGGGLVTFRDNFRDAVQSPDIGAIVIDIDSPGGIISLVPETAAEVRAARGSKPIIAVCNTMAASAAYWIASQADEVVCTTSGEAGSIGVYMVHEDYSKWNERVGVSPTYIKAGKYKAEGNPDEPLSEAGSAAWQQEVDDLYSMFLDAVAAGRGVSADDVGKGYGEGRCILAARALEAGLIDRIDTLETVIAELLGQEPDATEDGASGLGLPRGLTITKPSAADGGEPAAESVKCPTCGKFMAPGGECESCKASASDDDDETDPDDEPDEDDDEDTPVDEPLSAEAQRLTADLLFG